MGNVRNTSDADLSPSPLPRAWNTAGHRTQSRQIGVSSRGQNAMPFVHNFEGAIVSTRLSENLLWKALNNGLTHTHAQFKC